MDVAAARASGGCVSGVGWGEGGREGKHLQTTAARTCWGGELVASPGIS